MAQLAAFWAKLTMLVSTIRFSDIVDILIVAYLIYNVIMLIRKTNSYRLAQGVLLILIALWLSGVLKLTMFNRILQTGGFQYIICVIPRAGSRGTRAPCARSPRPC